VRLNTDYRGKDENGDAIYVHDTDYPILTFRCTVKNHGCVDKNTLITLANGEQIKIKDIAIGSYVLSYDHEKKALKENKVLNVINTISDKEWCELIFDDRVIICTKDHRFWTENRGYIEAFNLSADDVFSII
jgi:intein/homing endonuclease